MPFHRMADYSALMQKLVIYCIRFFGTRDPLYKGWMLVRTELFFASLDKMDLSEFAIPDSFQKKHARPLSALQAMSRW